MCKYHTQKMMRSGREPIYHHYCEHPDKWNENFNSDFMETNKGTFIGETSDTPHWCPFIPENKTQKKGWDFRVSEELKKYMDKIKTNTLWSNTNEYDWLVGKTLTAMDEKGNQITGKILKASAICTDSYWGKMVGIKLFDGNGIAFLVNVNEIKKDKEPICDFICALNKCHIKIENEKREK